MITIIKVSIGSKFKFFMNYLEHLVINLYLYIYLFVLSQHLQVAIWVIKVSFSSQKYFEKHLYSLNKMTIIFQNSQVHNYCSLFI
jgi:hypothetical protein